jgi:phosphoribosylformimino-5-aminoimidazole carboxamide ribotide isomerase
MCQRYGAEAVVVSVDAKEGQVAIRGWRETTRVSAAELVRRMAELGVRRIVYTDVHRDGTLTAPNFEAIARLVKEAPGLAVLASGGISSLAHLKELSRLGVEGAIVGRALYTGAIDLGEAIRAVGRER